MQPVFEVTYEPEIALFAPPPPTPRETVSTPSTTFRGTFPLVDQGPSQWAHIATPLNGTKAEETSIVRQVSLRQRSARLSFLPGRRQHHQQQQQQQQPSPTKQEGDEAPEMETAPGSPEPKMSTSRSRSFSKSSRRQSIFKPPSVDESLQDAVNGSGRRGSSASKGSVDRKSSSIDEFVTEAEYPVVKRSGSMRKRLSLFKMGIKSSKHGGTMRSVDEE